MQHKVDVFDTSVSLTTPLMEAINRGHIDVASYLVQSGASLMTQDVRNENAIHHAARCSTRMLRALIKAANYNSSQIQGVTSVINVKRHFPEDLAVSDILFEVLVSLRERGTFPVRRKREKNVNTQSNLLSIPSKTVSKLKI